MLGLRPKQGIPSLGLRVTTSLNVRVKARPGGPAVRA